MREKILFDTDWLFHFGDVEYKIPTQKGPIYTQAKTERFRFGPASKTYIAVEDDYSREHELNPETWVKVNLPHDYIIGQEPKKENNNALGYFEYENAWYRKTFSLTEEDQEKRICLYFEGIATNSTIYLNGCLMKHNFCGYSSFEVDITDYVEIDKENILAVYVDGKSNFEGWWYQGAGIYRHVWLVKTEQVSVDLYGVYVKPKRTDNGWKLTVENTLRNDNYEDKQVTVLTDIINDDEVVLSMRAETNLPYREKNVVVLNKEIENPHLWSIEDPHQYKARTRIFIGEEEIDCYEVKFGFRYYEFDAKNGFSLNGKKIFINGLCAHADFGLTGKAVPDNIQKYKIALMKEMGANGFRCSHYPHAEATMDALDEMGFVVMAETRWFEATDEGIEQLEMLVKRDRNRPSVCFWSMGNEEPKFSSESGIRICKHMMDVVRKLDDTRMVVCAVDAPGDSTVYEYLDAIGINYNLNKYDELHAKYPEKMIFASECGATGTTRDWNFNSCGDVRLRDKDRDANAWFLGRERTRKILAKKPYVFGAYQWAAVEHRGEASWPAVCSKSGALDLFLQKKGAFYQNQSHWLQEPMVHIVPHWNFEGLEGRDILVTVYTNCDELELFLNKSSLGRKAIEKYGHGEWNVPYEKGELLVKGYRNGQVVAQQKKETTGKAVALKLTLENTFEANGEDLAIFTCECVDEEGRVVPDAAEYVRFSVSNPAVIVGTGSDHCDHNRVGLAERKMYMGKIAVAVRPAKGQEYLELLAQSDHIKPALYGEKIQ